jgi:Uma2 family endonuclease
VSVSNTTEYELLTADDFFEWLEPGRRADLIDGEVELHSPVSIRHAQLLSFVDRLLGQYVDQRSLGMLFREAVAVRLSSRNVFLADLAFYRTGRESSLHETYVAGPPDLVVEVLSPRTAERDVGPKFAEYEQHGVHEYWILDPETLAHRFYRRQGDILIEYGAGEEEVGSATVEGFFLVRSWLDPAKLPKIADAPAQIERRRG